MTAPSPPRRGGASPARRYASPAAAARNRSRASAARSATGPRPSSRRPGPPLPSRRPPAAHGIGLTLTTRAALLGLAVCAVVLTLVYPAREYLAQHRQISQLAQQVAKTKASVQALTAAGQRDSDPVTIENEARLRLHYQRPGDKVFILTPVPPKRPGKQTAGAVHTPELPGRTTQPWYSQLYRSTIESGK